MKPSEQLDSSGKSLPVSWQKTLDKCVGAGLLALEYNDPRATIVLVNPFSGAEVRASALCAAIVDIILIPDITSTIGRASWDNLRYTVNACWPDVYYAIVD